MAGHYWQYSVSTGCVTDTFSSITFQEKGGGPFLPTAHFSPLSPTHAIHIHNSQLASSLSSSTVLCVVLYSSVAVNTTVAVLTLLAGVAALQK